LPLTMIDLPVGVDPLAAHRAYSPLQIIMGEAETVRGNSASKSNFFMFVLDFYDHLEQ